MARRWTEACFSQTVLLSVLTPTFRAIHFDKMLVALAGILLGVIGIGFHGLIDPRKVQIWASLRQYMCMYISIYLYIFKGLVILLFSPLLSSFLSIHLYIFYTHPPFPFHLKIITPPTTPPPPAPTLSTPPSPNSVSQPRYQP